MARKNTIIATGNLSDRPSVPEFTGQVFVALDTGDIYKDTSGAWARAGGTGVIAYRTADRTAVTNTTLVDDGVVSVTLEPGNYTFRFVIFITNGGAAEGVKLAVNGTAGVTSLKAQIAIFDDTLNSEVGFARVTSFGSSVGAGLSSGDNYCEISGSIQVSTAGTLTFQVAQNATGAGAGVTVQKETALVVNAGSGGTATIVVQKDDTNVDTAVATLDFEGDDFDVSSSPAGEANISSRFIGARVYNSSGITTTTAVATAMTYNSERYDTDNIHSIVSNTSRLTAPIDGYYHIGACVSFSANGTGERTLYIQVNGSIIIVATKERATAAGSTQLAISADYFLSANDYVEAFTVQNSGGNLDVASAANYSPEMWMHRISGS